MRKKVYSKKLHISIIAFALLLISLFVGIYINSVINERNFFVEKEKSNLTDLGSVISVQTNSYFEKISIFFEIADLWLGSHPEADPRTNKDFIELVNAFRKSTEGKIDIRLVSDSGGLFYIPSKSLKPLADVSDRKYYKVQLSADTRGFSISDPVLSRVTGKWGIPISYPLKNKNAGISIIFAAVEISNLNQIYEPFRGKPNGKVLLVRNDGVILAKTPANDKILGRSLAGGEFWKNYVHNSLYGTGIFKNVETDNVQCVVSYRKVEGFPLYIQITSDMKDILEEWNKMLPGRIAMISLLVIMIIGLVLFILHLLNDLDIAMNKATRSSVTDPLTDLFNRRAIHARFIQEIERAERYDYVFSLIMMDIDHFKILNDTYGHDFGDRVLIAISNVLKGNVRKTDIVSRWGGEEFMLLCESVDSRSASILAGKLREIIEAADFEISEKITCSFGVTEYHKLDTIESMMKRVDEALYASKNEGRNRVTILN